MASTSAVETGNPSPAQRAPEQSGPWWHYPHVWMIIAGPAIVVVAGFVTLWLAIRTPDPVVDENYYQSGLNINETLRKEAARRMMPAVQGRNHAAQPAEESVPSGH